MDFFILLKPTAGYMTYGHLRADCLYAGISCEPNARYRVLESLYLYLYLNLTIGTDVRELFVLVAA